MRVALGACTNAHGFTIRGDKNHEEALPPPVEIPMPIILALEVGGVLLTATAAIIRATNR